MLKMPFLQNIVDFEQQVQIFPAPMGLILNNTILGT